MVTDGAGPAGPDPEAELRELRGRVASLEAEHAVRRRRHRGRSFLAAVLIVVGCVLAPLAVVAAWAADQVGDTDRYVATVGPLASEPAVQDAVADRATDALMARIDLSTMLSDVPAEDRPRLEKALGRLGDSLEGAVRALVHDKARAVARSSAFAALWEQGNRQAHGALDKALTGKGGGAVRLEDDTVTLDLAPVVARVEQRLVDAGLTAADRIPELHTGFTLVRSENVGKARTYVRLLQLAGNWLPVVALALLAAGVLLSVRRRRALVGTALAAAVATGLLGVGLRVFRVLYLDRLPASVSQDAAAAVYDALTRFLFTTVRMVVALGVVVALAAWLTGPGRRASLVRGVWTSGIEAARTTAEHAGWRTGRVGPFVRRFRAWFTWVPVAAALLVYLFWDRPTAWVVVGIALCLLVVLAVVEFVGGTGRTAPGAATAGGPDG
ncbi:hypothetical protein [Streptomyces sp. NPDC049813]|uniref:hypothetical protein n=1 Tax=Streptomyces sp. NPDC049813 TaxID=3365597 RepID=UPI003798FEE7